MRILPLTVMAIAILSFTAAQAADVYRWVDDNGVTHYADAPPSNKQYQRLNVRTGATNTQVDIAETDADADNAKTKEAESQAAIAARAERCRIAKQNLVSLHSGFAMIPDENGQSRSMTDEEVQQQIDLNQRAVDQSCPAP